MYLILKTLISASIIVIVSEIAKKYTWSAAIIISIPLTSLLAFIWLYYDTNDIQKVISLSNGIFLAVLPSLLFFAILPMFLKMGVNFTLAMLLSILIMFLGYSLYAFLLSFFGIKL